MNKEEFIKKAKEVHGEKYDYSKVEYLGSQKKVCIICPEHGEFWQIASSHLRGYGCLKCSNEKRGKRDTLANFIEKSIIIHGNKYNYSKVNYVNASTKVCIICSEHGKFWQTPSAHLMGQGCPKCKGRNLSKGELIEKFRNVHGNRYDYSEIHYLNSQSKLKIICPEHGEFYQSSSKHLQGQGCPKCAIEQRVDNHRVTREDFISRAEKIHDKKYDYSEMEYYDMVSKIKIICPKHGLFYQRPYDHLQGHGCPNCGTVVSLAEIEIYKFLCDILGAENIEYHNRIILSNNKEIDIYIPSLNVGIEYNGLKWHSEEFGKTKFYHLKKTNECRNKGIKLIHIFEDEYMNSKDIVLSKILHIIGKNDDIPKIMGRKCRVKEISKEEAKAFLNKYHIQGYGKSTLSLGCFYKKEIIGAMSFTKEKNNRWILTRFASNYNYLCQGLGGKIFSYFIKQYNPNEVKSFADRRWTLDEDHNLYTNLKFKLDKILPPDYHYVDTANPKIRIHKFNLRKKTLHRKYGFNMDITEKEMVSKLGYSKIWDCGLIRYIWKKGV